MLNDDGRPHVQKQAGADHAGNGANRRVDRFGIVELGNAAIENVIAVVGEHALAGFEPHFGLESEGGQCPLAGSQAERHDFDRQFAVAAELGDELFAADQDDKPAGAGGHDPFADQGAAIAFDQIAVGIDFVGTVDVDVDGRHLFERGQRNPQLDGQIGRRLRGGNAADAEALAEPHGELLDECRGGMAGSQPDDRAVGDPVERAASDGIERKVRGICHGMKFLGMGARPPLIVPNPAAM